MSSSALTTTSYAILGLLAIKPWSTYELAQQMDRSLGRIWPRAQSKLYEEPKKLVARGLVASGAAVVLVSISADLTRDDANYLQIKRL